MPEWDGLLPPVSCGERPIIDSVRTSVAYSNYSADRFQYSARGTTRSDSCLGCGSGLRDYSEQ